MRLTAEGAAARAAWTRIVRGDRFATVSQTPAWMDCVCASGDWEDATRAYETGDRRELVLPLARRKGSRDRFRIDASMPFGWGTGGLLCAGGRLTADDVSAVGADLYARPPIRATLRPSPEMEAPWAAGMPSQARRSRHMSQSVDLAGGFAKVATGFSGSTRRNIRKAERGPMTVEWDSGPRLVCVFDALYRASVKRWAEQQHEPQQLAQWRARRRDPRRKFESVATRLRDACSIGVAWRSGEAVAAIIVLAHGEHSTYWRGAMNRELAAGTGANELLHAMAIEAACDAGRRSYHMGDSAPASALAEFKRRLGAREEHYTGYRLERWPLSEAEELARRAAKRVLGFRD